MQEALFESLLPDNAELRNRYNASEDQKSYRFYDLAEEICIYEPEEALSFLERIDNIKNNGMYFAGAFAYELGYFLNNYFLNRKVSPYKLDGISSRSMPLIGGGIYRRYETYSGFVVEPESNEPGNHISLDFSPTGQGVTRQEYLQNIEKIKDHIAGGNTYQVNYTFPLGFKSSMKPYELYKILRKKQRTSYCAYLEFAGYSILSFSPELFFRIENGQIIMRPMKGTSARFKDSQEDAASLDFLIGSTKDRAENAMIVDLLRNDAGRICEMGSVYVENPFSIESYETVHQMVSTIRGKLNNVSFLEIMKAMFPCGSVTGAPRLRTMEIIHELEKTVRGFYTGAIGFILPEKIVMNVAIRTLQMVEDDLQMGVGSGIVWDSQGEKEYEECLLKAQFLR